MKYFEEKKCLVNPIYIIIISVLISPLLIINSSNKINQRKAEIFNNNNENLFFNDMHLRNLDFISDSKEVCDRSSEDLSNYFKTGDEKYVKLYAYNENNEPSDAELTLINLFSDEGVFKENKKNYLNHLSWMIIFFIFALLCFPIWILFCVCSFCNCNCLKCFNCCKQQKCKIPFFIVLITINGIFIILCSLGIAKISPVFEALTSTECSILSFINEILDGEIKNILPKWGGILEILNILTNTANLVDEMSRDNSESTAENKKNAYDTAKESFLSDLKTACDAIKGENTYKYETNYILDIANDFGTCNTDYKCSSDSYAVKWISEAEITTDVDSYYTLIGLIIRSSVSETMKDAKEVFQDIGESIEDLRENVGKKIIKVADKIDKIGKLIFRLIFIILLIISLLLLLFFIFLLLHITGKCTSDCLASTMKFLINIFWNILIIISIISFLLGGIIIIAGVIGNEVFGAFSYLISNKNLESPSPRIFGDAAEYLNICFNGDGQIVDELGFLNDLDNIGKLKKLTKKLDNIMEKLTERKSNTNSDYVYDELINELNKRKDDQIDFGFVNPGNINEHLNLYETITNLNSKLELCNINDGWSFSCSSDFPNYQQEPGTCISTVNTSRCMNPKNCKLSIDNRYTYSQCNEAYKCSQIIKQIYNSINFAASSGNANSILKKADEVKSLYRNFLTAATQALEDYTIRFRPFNAIFDVFVGDESILGFINCAFIGKNIKIVLYYLKETIGKNFITLGLIFIVIAVIILCEITFTIFLLSIINEMNKIEEIDNQRTYQIDNNNVRIIPVSLRTNQQNKNIN